ncbi:MAG TPA: spermidine/putrescine ABC transporter substrate-binding protein [Opitutaceae bacterium]|nr:spermidine/putrescine ABC transporter substrate-binding protein [Opitutaceae bacterium]
MKKRLSSLFAIGLALGAALDLSAAKKEVNLFGWSEYVPQDVLDKFEEETGIKVNYETYASNEEMLSKLLGGAAEFDLVQPSEYVVEALVKAGKLEEIDFANVPNMKNVGAEFLHQPHDPQQKYSVPYMAGTVGIVVNTEKVKEPIAGMADVFSGKYAGRIVTLNDNREILTWALRTLGRDINDISPAAAAAARPVLTKWLPQIKVYDSDSPKTSLLNGDVDIGVVWSGEAAILFNEDKKFAYVLPKEGAHLWIDSLVIPKGAPHKADAEKFINFILRPDISVLISNAFPYTNPNLEARKLLAPEQLANPASFPSPAKLESFHDIGKSAALVDKLITDLKGGS